MVDGKVSPFSGLKSRTPLGGKIGHVKVGVRPVDPVLVERISGRLGELKEKGVDLPDPASLAIRSVDGFYFFPSLSDLSRGDQEKVISVINYDPVRRTFLLSRDGEPNEIMELFWFGFETFPTDMVLLYLPFEYGNGLNPPEDTGSRINLNIGIMKEWKDSRLLEHSTGIYWRGEGLDPLLEYLRTYHAGRSRDHRSQ